MKIVDIYEESIVIFKLKLILCFLVEASFWNILNYAWI